MNSSQQYAKAPITEAIIDLRFVLPDSKSLDDIKSTHLGEENRYPQSNEMFALLQKVKVDKGTATTEVTQHESIGYRFASLDGKSIWQARKDGFTYSKLAPYEGWSPFVSEAKRLWEIVRSKLLPNSIERVAVRYINRIDIETSLPIELKDYFKTGPEISPALTYDLNGFFLQISLAAPDICGHVFINQTIDSAVREGVCSFILDIDVIRDQDVPMEEVEIWDFFEKLHVRKNEIFEACITDKTRGLFE